MGCNSPRCGKGTPDSPEEKYYSSRSHITVAVAGEQCLNYTDSCPLDGSGLRLIRRPKSHFKCRANGHAWNAC